MAVESSKPFFSPSFSEALHFSSEALKLESQVSLKPEQRMAIQAVYEGNDVFVLLYTHRLWQESLLPNPPVRHGLQDSTSLVGTEKISAVLVISSFIARV